MALATSVLASVSHYQSHNSQCMQVNFCLEQLAICNMSGHAVDVSGPADHIFSGLSTSTYWLRHDISVELLQRSHPLAAMIFNDTAVTEG